MDLIIISLNPTDEIFLSKEIRYLKEKFNIFFISRDREKYENITIDPDGNVRSALMDHPKASKIKWDLQLVLSLFKPEVWKEIMYVIKYKTFSVLSLKRILYYSAASSADSEKIISILRANGFCAKDRMLIYAYRMNTSALSVLKVQRYFKNAKCFARAHGVDLYEYRQKDNFLPFRSKILNGLCALYCISEDGFDYVMRYPFKKCMIRVSRLGTGDHGTEDDKCRDRDGRKPLLVSCSRVSPEKRIEKIADALSLIQKEVRWIHIGGGDTLNELKEYVREKLEKKSNIEYDLAGNMDNSDVIRFYKDNYIDVFINVSSVEGIPVSIMEAGSFGIPIIATDVGGTSEIVTDNYNGYLLPPDFSDELLASDILSIIQDGPGAARFRENARSEWEKKYDEDMNYRTFADEISHL